MEIDNQVAKISLALLNRENDQALELAATLQFSILNLEDGAYTDNEGKQRMTISTYLLKLRQAKSMLEQQRWTKREKH